MGYLEEHRASRLKVGDKVIVTRKAKSEENGWCNGWDSSMDCLVGKTCTITVDNLEYGFSLNDSGYDFPYFILEPVDKKISFLDI